MLMMRMSFGAVAALWATLVYGEAGRMQDADWAAERAEHAMATLRRGLVLLPAPARRLAPARSAVSR